MKSLKHIAMTPHVVIGVCVTIMIVLIIGVIYVSAFLVITDLRHNSPITAILWLMYGAFLVTVFLVGLVQALSGKLPCSCNKTGNHTNESH